MLDLDLDADLVVLAACDTASGRRLDGDGVQSLSRAFLHAGARAVIASFWEIRDLEAGEFMKSFYTRYLEQGLSPSDALRRTKLAFLSGEVSRGEPVTKDHRHPRYSDLADPCFWAGFVCTGPSR